MPLPEPLWSVYFLMEFVVREFLFITPFSIIALLASILNGERQRDAMSLELSEVRWGAIRV